MKSGSACSRNSGSSAGGGSNSSQRSMTAHGFRQSVVRPVTILRGRRRPDALIADADDVAEEHRQRIATRALRKTSTLTQVSGRPATRRARRKRDVGELHVRRLHRIPRSPCATARAFGLGAGEVGRAVVCQSVTAPAMRRRLPPSAPGRGSTHMMP